METSKSRPVLIFKHSTRCSVSDAAYDELMKYAAAAGDVPCGIILVIENRSLSNSIASEFGIPHASPQAIVFENGRPRWNASHWAITAETLEQALRR